LWKFKGLVCGVVRVSGGETASRVFYFGEFVLDCRRGALYRHGVQVRLRPKCFEVLQQLVIDAGQLVTKDQLLETVWRDIVVTDGSVAQCIAEIRQALGDTKQDVIRTVPRRGFVFELAVSDVPTMPPSTKSSCVRGLALALTALVVIGASVWWGLGRQEPGQPTPAESVTAAPPPASIAVLRFVDMSPTGDHGYFADGLAEEIIYLLAQSPGLRVTARTSSFAFAPGSSDVATIARELGVSYLVEGSVRRQKERIRVTIQLIDAATRFHVLSRTYDRKFDDTLELQQGIASEVSAALDVAIPPLRREPTPAQARAHDLFLLGRHLFHRRSTGDLRLAEQKLQQAVELDPGNAAAWTMLAAVYNVYGADELGDPLYRLEDQRRALERALEIEPSHAEAHVRLARYNLYKGNLAASRSLMNRAFQLAPNDPLVLATRAVLARLDGRFQDALDLERRAVAVNPLSALYRFNFGRWLLGAGRFEEGLKQLVRARELSPDADRDGRIATALLLLGRDDEARVEVTALADGPDRDKLTALMGSAADSQAAQARLEADHSLRGQLRLAEMAAYRGQRNTAFRRLEAIASSFSGKDMAYVDFGIWHDVYSSGFLVSLHGDSRWWALVDSVRQSVPWGHFLVESEDPEG